MARTFRDMERFAFNGWRGWVDYFKAFSRDYRQKEIAANRGEVLLLYRRLHKLVREKCYRFGLREQKRSELRVLFKDSKTLTDLQDIRLFYNIGCLVKERLESGEFPPFPRRYFDPSSVYHQKEHRNYRKYIRNIDATDYILEPGQDPPRHPFYETRQFHRDYSSDPRLVKYQTDGVQFDEEEKLLGK